MTGRVQTAKKFPADRYQWKRGSFMFKLTEAQPLEISINARLRGKGHADVRRDALPPAAEGVEPDKISVDFA